MDKRPEHENISKEHTDPTENKDNKDKKDTEQAPTKTAAEKTPERTIPEERHLRVLAEFENYKKRLQQQLRICEALASKRLIKLLLPVMNEMELAIAQTSTGEEDQGIVFIYKKMIQILKNEGLAPIIAAEGDDFNPDCHEAISSIVAEEGKQGKIAQIMSKGYTFNGEVIAFTKVVVNT